MNLGRAARAWEMTSLSNERDRPALSLPHAAAVCECLEVFGWKGTRQEPINRRSDEPNVLQPAILSSGLLSIQLTRLTDDREITSACVTAKSPEALVEDLFLRFLGRAPSDEERDRFVPVLAKGFKRRVVLTPPPAVTPVREANVTWANHLNPESTQIRLRQMESLRWGPEATGRLKTDWRQRAEDVLWALINTPEFQMIP